MGQGRRLLLTVGIPVVLVGSIFYESYLPRFLHKPFDHWLMPFSITYWLGLLFSNMYFYMTQELEQQKAGKGVIAICCGVVALLFLMAGGGPSLLWRDPWLFGITVMPGIDIALPAARQGWQRNQAKQTGGISDAVAANEPAAQSEAGPGS